MKELAYWLGGFGAWLITLWMARKFIQTEILDAITAAKHVASRAESACHHLSEVIAELKVSIARDNAKLQEEVSAQTLKMSNLFTDCVSISTLAKTQAENSINQVKEMKEISDKRFIDIKKAGGSLLHKISGLESEVKKISEQLFLVRSKKNGV